MWASLSVECRMFAHCAGLVRPPCGCVQRSCKQWLERQGRCFRKVLVFVLQRRGPCGEAAMLMTALCRVICLRVLSAKASCV